METTQLQTDHDDRLAIMVERYLDNPSAYKLLAMLAPVSRLNLGAKLEFMALAKEAGVYTDEDMCASAHLMVNGAAQYLKEVVDQVRDEQVQREIAEMLS